MRRAIIYLAAALTLLALAGCGAAEAASPPLEGGSVTGAALQREEAGRQTHFRVSVAEAGQPIGVDFRGSVQRGSVRLVLVDESGRVVWSQQATEGPAPFVINTTIPAPWAGTFELGMAWDEPVTVSYALTWRPGAVAVATVTPLALLPGLGMVAVALCFVAYAARRRLGWGYLGWGALAWLVAVALKFAWAMPTNAPVYNALQGALPPALSGAAFYIYVGALTGVFEVGLVYLALRYTRLGRAGWPKALAFGIGFGAVEALLLGVSSLASTLATLLMPGAFPLEMLAAVARQGNPLYGLAPVVERAATLFVHILSNLLIFYAIHRRRPGWFWLAFAFKTAIDSAAAFAQFWGLATLSHIWAIEAVVIAFGVVGWLGLRWLRPHFPVEAGAGQPAALS